MKKNNSLAITLLLLTTLASKSMGYYGKCDPCDPPEPRQYPIQTGDLLELRKKNLKLFVASSYGKIDDIRALLDEGAEARVMNNEGMTPLHWAAYNGHDAIIHELINAGADINARDKDGLTPLHWAATRAQNKAIEALLDRGADINALNEKNETALHIAAHSLFEDTVNLLLERGIYPYKLSNQGYTAYIYALRPRIRVRDKDTQERILALLEYI